MVSRFIFPHRNGPHRNLMFFFLAVSSSFPTGIWWFPHSSSSIGIWWPPHHRGGFFIFPHRNLMVSPLIFLHRNLMAPTPQESYDYFSFWRSPFPIGIWWFTIGFLIFSHRNLMIIVSGWMKAILFRGVVFFWLPDWTLLTLLTYRGAVLIRCLH